MTTTKKINLTIPGSVNRNGQRVNTFVRKEKNNPLLQVYQLTCTLCAYDYNAYASDLWQRKCPECQDGTAGLPG